jgi:hypothetical protein
MHTIDWDILKTAQRRIWDEVDAKLRTLQVGQSLAMRVQTPPIDSFDNTLTLVLRVVNPGQVIDDGPWTVYGPFEEYHRRMLDGLPPARLPVEVDEPPPPIAAWSNRA